MRSALVFAVLLCSCGLCSCGTDADGTYAGLTSFEPTSGAYRFWALAPPWKEPEGRRGRDEVRLEIPSNAERLTGPAMVPPKYVLTVDVVGGNARNRAQQIADRAPSEDEVVGPRMWITDMDVEGWETIVFDISEGRYTRHSYLPRPGGVVQMVFQANPNLDDPEVDAMIATLEVGPFDAP